MSFASDSGPPAALLPRLVEYGPLDPEQAVATVPFVSHFEPPFSAARFQQSFLPWHLDCLLPTQSFLKMKS